MTDFNNLFTIDVFIIAIIIGLIPAFIAKSKGYSFLLWWIYGAALFIVALPHSLLMKPEKYFMQNKEKNSNEIKCPYCAETIKREAKICRFCGKEIYKSNPYQNIYCPNCNKIWDSSHSVCPECKTNLTTIT